MPKIEYKHPSGKAVYFSAPTVNFHTYKNWLDFCLGTYPIKTLDAVDVRFQKRDHFQNISHKGFNLYGGLFKCKWRGVGDIAVCVGKTFTSPEEEVRFIFFHEYGHCLQLDQGRDTELTYEANEADADAFAEMAIKQFLSVTNQEILCSTPT